MEIKIQYKTSFMKMLLFFFKLLFLQIKRSHIFTASEQEFIRKLKQPDKRLNSVVSVQLLLLFENKAKNNLCTSLQQRKDSSEQLQAGRAGALDYRSHNMQPDHQYGLAVTAK